MRDPLSLGAPSIRRELQRLQQVAGHSRQRSLDLERTARQLATQLRTNRDALEQAKRTIELLNRESTALRAERDALRSELDQARAEQTQERQAAVELSTQHDAAQARTTNLLADLANVRRQREASISRASSDARAQGIAELARVRDDIERALDAGRQGADDAWLAGTRSLLNTVDAGLRQLGAVPVGVQGDVFDPTVHESVGRVPGPTSDRVASVTQQGFMAEGRLVRPAKVIVTQREH